MNCDNTILTLYWSGELSEAEARQVEEHLADCETCRRELAELRELDSMVQELEPEQAPRDFVSDVMGQTVPRRSRVIEFLRRPAVSYPAFGAVAMAAAILLVVMGPWFGSSPVTRVSSVIMHQSAHTLYSKVTTANRQHSFKRRTSNFRARTGQLAKKIQLTKRLSTSRKTFRRTR